MKILALEFSSPQRSVAVVDAGRSTLPVLGSACESGAGNKGALALVEAALHEAKFERERIECVALGLGPGSYAGIRAAISLAQGWQLARGIKLLGLASVECVAAQAQAEGLSGRMHIIIDAQRNEFYMTTYEIKAGVLQHNEPLRLATFAEVESKANASETLIGPEVTCWFPSGRIVFPDAGVLGKLAAGRTDFVPGEKLEPIYLRQISYVKAPPPTTIV
jgi:tRNA threonylcarbamoyl adenosine modification protein YeaZ